MNILLIGQIALHWGRLEFGNMGNYYIIEPFIREIHRVFPDAAIKTVFQMSEQFCARENIEVLPMELYYGYRDNELELARQELIQAEKVIEGNRTEISLYLQEVLKADLVLDLSGDMWGDNADIAGKDRFEVGLIKDRVVQLLEKPIFMLAGSPGPFDITADKLSFAKEVFKKFDIVTNREPVSKKVLEEYGFDTNNVSTCACPSFLFEPVRDEDLINRIKNSFVHPDKPIIGFILCGWNFEETPFSKWPRDVSEYTKFVALLESICEHTDANICLVSHSNGFPIPPAPFELLHGRDYYVVEQLYQMMQSRPCADRIALVEDVCDVWHTKGLIGEMDMLVSGRVHGAVAGLSQCVPTVIIDYGQEPKAHKLRGFAELTEQEEYIASPDDVTDMIETVLECWQQREEVRQKLKKRIPVVQELARRNMETVWECYVEKIGQ